MNPKSVQLNSSLRFLKPEVLLLSLDQGRPAPGDHDGVRRGGQPRLPPAGRGVRGQAGGRRHEGPPQHCAGGGPLQVREGRAVARRKMRIWIKMTLKVVIVKLSKNTKY